MKSDHKSDVTSDPLLADASSTDTRTAQGAHKDYRHEGSSQEARR